MSAQRERVPDYSWLHDDMEEDLVGADWHQRAIRTLVTSLRDLARQQGWPWHISDQLALVGWKPDGTPWRPSPDVSVHPTLGPEDREEIDVRTDGPSALIIEIASRTTWEYDVSLERAGRVGKAFAYLVLGVPEYLVFDPTARLPGTPCRGWRRVGEATQEWRPESDGRYHSRPLRISFRPEGDLLRVIAPDGSPMPYDHEKDQTIGMQAQENAALRQEIADLRAELERLRTQRTDEQD
jgi:Uma2 family endonuclease